MTRPRWDSSLTPVVALPTNRARAKKKGAPTGDAPEFKPGMGYFGCGMIRRYGRGAFQPSG